MRWGIQHWLWVAALFVTLGSAACGGDGTTTQSGPSGPGGNGGTAGAGAQGAGGSGASGGVGGTGGTGGQAFTGKSASALVNAGNQATSPSYNMVQTFGQPTQNQGTMTSPSYRMQGGLIGATGTLP